MMKKRSLIVVLCAFFAIVGIGLIYFFGIEDKRTSLTVFQKKWIERNKNKVIDFSVFSGVPIINNNGNGIVFDFLNSLESDTGLEFNKLSYPLGKEPSSDYSVTISDKVGNNILLYEDNYALVTKKKLHFNSSSEISNFKIGVLKNNIDEVNTYLSGSSNISFTPFDSEQLMFGSLQEEGVDGIVVPKLDCLQQIIKDNYHIAYNISEYTKKYVISLGNNKKLNNILKKYFENYRKSKYKKSVNKYFADAYFTLNKIDEREQTSFRSKRYSYGFVIKPPYEVTLNGTMKGINSSIIKDFSNVANIEIDYKRYSSIENVVKDFNENKIDFISGDVGVSKFDMDVYNTVSPYSNTVSVITKGISNLSLNNVSSLKSENVLCVKNSKISKYLKANGIKVTEFKNVKDLIGKLRGNKIGAVDEYVYDYYVRRDKSLHEIGNLDYDTNYGFIVRNVKDNKIISEFLDFYLSFYNVKSLINNSYDEVLSSNNSVVFLQVFLIILVILLIALTLFFGIKILKKKRKYDIKLSKADKLRYIDSLTSLKNRKYLNDNISSWDKSEVYPQCIIIIDLNNIAYINDNFGHKEGDKVIALGAGILINNQLSDSEIVRTNGNEFLIFTIGHDEKTIISYMRKLNKEFKELSHGFGAAIGYSMINDEIKTVDDAINEATIDMRNNKEEASS